MMTTQTPPDSSRANKQELVRPIEGRIVAGVAAALAQRLEIPTWLVRLIFAITTVVGGLGIVAYLAGWLLIRDQRQTEPHAVRMVEGLSNAGWAGVALAAVGVIAINNSIDLLPGGALFGLVLVVIGALMYMGKTPFAIVKKSEADSSTSSTTTSPMETPIMTDTPGSTLLAPTGGDAPPIASQQPVPSVPKPPKAPKPKSALGRITFAAMLIGVGTLALIERMAAGVDFVPRHYLALLLGITGIGLLVGTWMGRARGLIVVGILLVPLLALSPLAELDYSRLTRTTEKPMSLAEVKEVYGVDVGSLVVDLSTVDFKGDSISVVVTADLGEVIVIVPTDIAVSGEASVDVGEVEVFGRSAAGLGDIRRRLDQSGSNGNLDLTATVDVGRVIVTNDSTELSFGPIGNDSNGTWLITDPGEFDDVYDMGFGSITIDLTQLVLTSPETLKFDLGAGEITVIVPADMAVSVEASASLGEVTVFGRSDSGFSPQVRDNDDNALLRLDLSVGAGSITVEES